MHLHVSVTGESPSTVRYPACKSVPWCVCLVRVITSSRPLWNKRIYAQRAHDSGPGGVVTQARAASPVTAARLLLCCRRDRRRKHTYSRIPMGCEEGQGPRAADALSARREPNRHVPSPVTPRPDLGWKGPIFRCAGSWVAQMQFPLLVLLGRSQWRRLGAFSHRQGG